MVGEKTLASILITLLNSPVTDKAIEPVVQPRVEVARPADPKPQLRAPNVPQYEYEGRDSLPRPEAKRPKESRAALARAKAADRKRRFASRDQSRQKALDLLYARIEEDSSSSER